MTDNAFDPTARHHPAATRRSLPLDLPAVLEGLQDQIDDLTAVVEAQQERIADLTRQLARTSAH